MRKSVVLFFLLLAAFGTCFADISVSAPYDGQTVGAPVHVVASAWADIPISSIIVYIDQQPVTTVYQSSIDVYLPVGPGYHTMYVKAWDNWGRIYEQDLAINVSGETAQAATAPAAQSGNVWTNIQAMGDWGSCTVCAGAGGNGPSADYWMGQWQSSPSLSGQSSEFHIGGSTPYSDVLWWKQLDNGSQVNEDTHHLVYDADFYIDNADAAQALEFDINQFVDGRSYIFGSQCNVRAGNHWDIWDNVNNQWISTGIWCGTPTPYQWHHVRFEVERTWDNYLHYVSITFDGEQHYIDWYYPSTGTDWNGITVNFQLDGNYAQQGYNVWLDNLTLTHW